VVDQIIAEMRRGAKKYGRYASLHEAYAVIKEEVDEMWDAIKSNSQPHGICAEAIQVAATTMRMVVEFQRGPAQVRKDYV
jgi:NTP pyrophosphatase (non-canonical NTP hydrolase)